jgi:hypothetical protein
MSGVFRKILKLIGIIIYRHKNPKFSDHFQKFLIKISFFIEYGLQFITDLWAKKLISDIIIQLFFGMNSYLSKVFYS